MRMNRVIRSLIGVVAFSLMFVVFSNLLSPLHAQEASSFKEDIEFLKENAAAALLFVPFGSNASFARHNLSDAQVEYLCGDATGNFTGTCANIGANFGTTFKTGRYNKARQFGMQWTLEIARNGDAQSVANAINGENIPNVIVRIGVAGDGIGFSDWKSNGSDYISFIKQVDSLVGDKPFYIIAGPNEPDLESDWFAPECGNAPGTAGPEADAWYPCAGPKLAQYMNAVCSAVKSDPALSNVKVLSPAFNMTSYSFPGIESSMTAAGADWGCLDGIAGNLYAAGKSVRAYWSDEFTGTTLQLFKDRGKQIYITETGGEVEKVEKQINRDDFYIHPILGLSDPADYDTVRDDLVRQGYEVSCASPGFKITLNQDGVNWMEKYLEEENWVHHKLPGEGTIFGGENHYYESVRRIGVSSPIRSVLEQDYRDVLVPIYRDLDAPSQLKRDLEQYVSFKDTGSTSYSNTELLSASINSLLTEKQRCTESVKLLLAQDEMCQKLSDPSACSLYYNEVPGTDYNVKSLLDTYRYYARSGDIYSSCTNLVKDLNNPLREGMLNLPLNIEKSYRLAFLVTTIKLRYPTTSTMFNFFTHPNAGPIPGPNKPPHTIAITAFKIPDILTNKGTIDGDVPSGHTDWNDPEILTRNSLIPRNDAIALDAEGNSKRKLLLETARSVANREQTSQSEIFCLVGSRTSGIGVPQCMDNLSKALVDIINASAEINESSVECNDYQYEEPQIIADPGTLQPTSHPSRLYKTQFGASILDNLFSDPAHLREGSQYDPSYATTGDEDSQSPLNDWGIKSMFHVTPQLEATGFPNSDSDNRQVKHFLVYPVGYDLDTINTVLAGTFFDTKQLTSLLEEEKQYDRFRVLDDILNFDGGEYSHTFKDFTEVCETETRTDPFTLQEYTVNIYCDRTFGWSIGQDKNYTPAGIAGGKLGYWQWTIQKALNTIESLSHKYLEQCTTTEDFLLDQCGGDDGGGVPAGNQPEDETCNAGFLFNETNGLCEKIGNEQCEWYNPVTGQDNTSVELPEGCEPTIANPNPKVINIMSLNVNEGKIGKKEYLSEEAFREKAEKIAIYIKENNIHIAGLQELRNMGGGQHFAYYIQQALRDINYPMYLQLQNNKNREGLFVNGTFSVFPITPVKEIPLTQDRNALVSKIETSIGKIDFINVHVHHKTDSDQNPYDDFKYKIAIETNVNTNPDVILVGDINNGLIYQDYPSQCEPSPDNPIITGQPLPPCYRDNGYIDYAGLTPLEIGTHTYTVNSRDITGYFKGFQGTLSFDHPEVNITVSKRGFSLPTTIE